MATQNNYYTQEEAITRKCPEYSTELYHGETRAAILSTPCIGWGCADWIWHDELNDEGKLQGRCGKINLPEKEK